MRRRPLIVACSILAFLVVVASLGGIVLLAGKLKSALGRIEAFGPVAQTLPEELAAAKREGLRLTPADLRRTPPVPPERNAASLYVAMTRLLDARSKAETDRDRETAGRLLKEARTHVDRGAARLLFAKFAKVIRLAEQASARPDCDFQRHYEEGPKLLLPEYGSMREAGRLLALKACVQGADGDVPSAFRSVAAIAHMGRHAGREPIMIAMLVRIALDAIADRAFQVVLLSHQDSPQALALARATLADFGRPPDVELSIGGEIVLCRVVVGDLRAGRSSLDSLAIPNDLRAHVAHGRATVYDAWEARSISYWRSVESALRADRGDMLAQYRAFKLIGDAQIANDGKPTYELSNILLPVFSQAAAKVMGDEALRRMRATLVELVAYRQAHRAFPERLADLGGKLPLDPFTNRPLIYRREGAGFVLYSVGENFKDDGGIGKGPKPDDKMLDIVVRYPVRQ